MDPERDRLKHLLIILLEALSGPQEVSPPIRARIQEKAEAAGLDEGDVHLSLIHISEPTRRTIPSRMPSSA